MPRVLYGLIQVLPVVHRVDARQVLEKYKNLFILGQVG